MTTMKYFALCAVFPLACSMKMNKPLALSNVDNPHLTLAIVDHNVLEIAAMEKQFVRSQQIHNHDMEEIAKTLTLPKAIDELERSEFANSSGLKQIIGLVSGTQNLRSTHIDAKDIKGFGGLDGARKLINDMVYEAASKYDTEIAKCTKYYAEQCALMEIARGQISASNFVAASSRSLILDAQGNIDKCQKDIPVTQQELKDHNSQCNDQIKALKKKLTIVLGDIAVLTMILELSDCDKKSLTQMNSLKMYQCEDQCTKKDYVKFSGNEDLEKRVNELRSPMTQNLMNVNFADMLDDYEDEDDQEDKDESDEEKEEDEDMVDSLIQEDQPKKGGKKGKMPPHGATQETAKDQTRATAGAKDSGTIESMY